MNIYEIVINFNMGSWRDNILLISIRFGPIYLCSKIYLIYILGFYGNKGGSSPKWKHDKYEEVVQMEEPSSTTDN